MSKKEVSSLQRARRTKLLRTLLGLSRRVFYEKTGIPAVTQQYWENEEGPGITLSGAHKLFHAYEKLDIVISIEWLLYGKGNSPFLKNDWLALPKTIEYEDNISILALEELRLFQSHYKTYGTEHLKVMDQLMSPKFEVGDWVAGRVYEMEHISKWVDYDAIFITSNGDKLLKRLKQEANRELFLTCLNQKKLHKQFLSELSIIHFAPVIWVRKDI